MFLAFPPACSISNCSFFKKEAIGFLGKKKKREILRQLTAWTSVVLPNLPQETVAHGC